MLPIAITLLTLSLILLALALRGRLTARGLFCRKCKFDLQGLDPARPDPTCPECGRPLTTPKSTRPTLRRPHKPTLAGAAVLLLASAACFTLTSSNTTSRIITALPDRHIITLSRLGVGDALTELADRAQRVPPMSDTDWQSAIRPALAHQADTTIPFDPRWGAVLAQAFQFGQMSRDQMRDYAVHGLTISAHIRNRTAHGSGLLAIRIQQEADRIAANTTQHNGITTQARLTYRPIDAGWTGIPNQTPPNHDLPTFSGNLWIPAATPGLTGRSLNATPLRLHADWSTIQPNQHLTAYAQFELTLTFREGDEPIPLGRHRFEQQVRILPPDEPVVTTIHDDAVLNALRADMPVRILSVMLPAENDPPPPSSVYMAFTAFPIQEIPKGIAGTVSVRLGDEEWPLGRMVSGPVRITGGGGLNASTVVAWSVGPQDIPAAAETVRRWLDAGQVDIIFRTDPDTALDTVFIDEIHHADLIWPGVRLRYVGSPSLRMSFSTADPTFPASTDPPPPPPSPEPTRPNFNPTLEPARLQPEG